MKLKALKKYTSTEAEKCSNAEMQKCRNAK
jgi:hypothetical protein